MYSNILLALNKTEFDNDAVGTAIQMAKTFNSTIMMMYVIEFATLFKEDRQEEYAHAKKAIDEYIEPLIKRIKDAGISLNIEIKTGKPGMVVCNYAAGNPVDIVIMPVTGSAAEYIFSYCSKPVLSVRSGSKDVLRGLRILVVDDEPDILDIVEEQLDMCTVHKAKDHDSAVQYLEMNRYHLVVLDIMGVDGFDILQRTVKMGIPSVMLTAHALTKEALNKAAKLGATSFLPKEKMMDLEKFLADVIENNGKPVWKKLFSRMSSYFENELRWSPEDEKELIEKYGDVEERKYYL